MKNIRYIVPYDIEENRNENRQYSLAAKYKVDYIIDVLNKLDYSVEIISLSNTKNVKGFYAEKNIEISPGKVLYLCATFGAKLKLQKLFRYIFNNLWLLYWLLIRTKRNEQLIIYHSQEYIPIILLAKKLKNFDVILELEEFYYKFGLSSKWSENQEKKIITRADKYILSNINQMKEFDSIGKKPYCVVHGNYAVSNNGLRIKKDDCRVTVIFAGGIDRIRNSAHNAIQAAKFLNKDYILKIIGYGSDLEINHLRDEMVKVNEELGYEACIYCGTKTGKELQDFYVNADIALNLQNVHDYYMDYAFPSKIIAYLSYGLRVISTRIKTLESSSVAPYIVFVDSQKPKDLACEIMSIDVSVKNITAIKHINSLDQQFQTDMGELLLNDSSKVIL